MFFRTVAMVAFFGLSLSACLDAPIFGRDDGVDQGGTATATDPRLGMVLVHGATLDSSGTITPSAKDDDHGDKDDKGKGKGGGGGNGGGGNGGGGNGGGDNGGGGNAGTPPPPAPSSPSGPSTPGVSVASFWIDALEVSAADYAACVAHGACERAGEGAGCTIVAGLSSHPVNCVTYAQAARYCTFREKRLPASDEWTVAAGGASPRMFPWGSEPPDAARLNACGAECGSHAMYTGSDGFTQTAPRGSFTSGATPDGIQDLAGNVAEWVDAGAASIVRGGSFEETQAPAVGVRAVTSVAKDASKASIGFRCALDL